MESTRPNRTLQDEVEIIIDRVIMKCYFGKESHSIKDLYRLICDEVKKVNETKKLSYELACPSYSAVYSRVKKADKNTRLNQQEKRVIKKTETANDSSRPLQQVEVISDRLDLYIIEDVAGDFPVRPWNTMLVDCETGMIVGHYIHFDQPSHVSTMNALRQAFAP